MDAPRPERMSAPGKTEPKEAIARARTGDADAWGLLYGEYAPAIFRFCRRWLRTREDAENATMDIFAKLMRDKKLPQYAQNPSFTAWFYKMAPKHLWAAPGRRRFPRTRRAVARAARCCVCWSANRGCSRAR